MRIACITSSASRLAGGLFHSVRRLSQTTAALGVPIDVFCVADAKTDDDLPAWLPLKPRVATPIGPRRLACSRELGRWLREFDAKDAIVHLHGLWQHTSYVTMQWRARTGQPTVISPRGMLDPWAVRNSAWKKKLFGFLYEYRNIRTASLLHALAQSEYEGMRTFGARNPIAVIPNGIDVPTEESLSAKTEPPNTEGWNGSKVLLFLARVHPKKNLLPLVECWSKLGNKRQDWRLAIAGPDEVGYRAEVQSRIDSLGLGDEIRFIGPQFGAEKSAWLRRADAFILPSLSEGFPMAVLEAMTYRLPVVMTTACNFPEAVKENAAIEVDPTETGLASGLETLMDLSDAEANALGGRARSLVERNYTWENVTRQTIAVYDWLLGGGHPPPCVRLD